MTLRNVFLTLMFLALPSSGCSASQETPARTAPPENPGAILEPETCGSLVIEGNDALTRGSLAVERVGCDSGAELIQRYFDRIANGEPGGGRPVTVDGYHCVGRAPAIVCTSGAMRVRFSPTAPPSP